jgi:hypothetical protein
MPLRTVFGWQKPCYLLGEGYTKTFKELMETTEWDQYGVGKYEKCADCMVHCGFEGTATTDAVKNPLKLLKLAFSGIKTEGEMAPEISLANQRPANFVFSGHVEKKLAEIRASNPRAAKKVVPSESGRAVGGGPWPGPRGRPRGSCRRLGAYRRARPGARFDPPRPT